MSSKSVWLKQLLRKILPPILSGLFVVGVSFRRLIIESGFVIYRDLYPGQLYYPSLWSSAGSFLAIENYKFVTFTGFFLPLRVFGPDIFEKGVYLSAALIAYLLFYLSAFSLLSSVKGWNYNSLKRHLVSGLGALTFLLNPAAANIYFDFSLFVGYAFSPLIVLLWIEILNGKRRIDLKIILVSLLWWIAAIKAHFIIFGGLLLLVPFLVWVLFFGKTKRKLLFRNVLALIAIVGLYLLLGSYWLFPYLQASQSRFVGSYAPMTYESVEFLSYSPWYDTLRLLGSFKAWPYVRYTPPDGVLMPFWMLASWAIPILAVYGAVRHHRNWITWTLISFAIGGFIFACGTAPPFRDFYQWMVFGPLMPGLFRWLFRVASKWNLFLSLGASGLLTLGLADLLDRVQEKLESNNYSPKIAYGIVVSYFLCFLFFAWPSFTGDFDGALDPEPLPTALLKGNQWLSRQDDDFKVNWMPVTNGRELSWNRRPSGDFYTSISPQPSIATNWNRHPVLYYSYIYDSVAEDRIANLGEMLSILNTRFIAYHDDVVSTHIHEDVEPVSVLIESGEQALTEKFQAQLDLKPVWEDDEISILEVEHFAAPLYVPGSRYLVVGGLPLINSISSLENVRLDERGLYFDASRDQGIMDQEWDGIIMGLDAADHLMLSRLPVEEMLSIAQFTNHGIVTQDWARFDVYQFNWQSVLRERKIYNWDFDYGKLMVAHTIDGSKMAEPKTLRIPFSVPADGNYRIWARYLQHPQAGELGILIDGRLIYEFNATDPVTGFRWDELLKVWLTAGEHWIEFTNNDGFWVFNTMAVIKEDRLADLRAQAQDLYNTTPGLYFLEIENDFDLGGASLARETTALSGGRGVELNSTTPISTNLSIVDEGEYSLALRASLPISSAPLTLTLGAEIFSIQPQVDREELTWLFVDHLHLLAGDLQLKIETAGPVVLDAMAIAHSAPLGVSGFFFTDTGATPVISYEQIDSTRYQIYVQTEQPFTLALAETYDPLWRASGPDFQVSSTPLYGVINGFEIQRTGSYQILVEYQAQQGARLGTLFSAIVFISLGPSIWLLRRKNKQNIRQEDEDRNITPD